MANLLMSTPAGVALLGPTEPASLGRRRGIDVVRARRAVRELLFAMGEDPDREGLVDTADRVARSFGELCSGLYQDPAVPLARRFTAGTGELVLVTDIDFTSLCEHHLLPFSGLAHVAYLPAAGQVVGLSKIARAVDILARRPQIQEALTAQIADLLSSELGAAGVLVVVEAEHRCLSDRGARKSGAWTITTAHRGRLQDDRALRDETHRLIAGRHSRAASTSADPASLTAASPGTPPSSRSLSFD